MIYSIKILNYNFDKDYDNVRLFENKDAQSRFFDNIQNATKLDDVNFICKDLINASVTFYTNDFISLKKLLNYNYAVITNNENNEKLYFFINSIEQGSSGLIILNMTIDVFNTYIFDITFSKAQIERAHIDRWIKTDKTLNFNFNENSNLFEREQIKDLSKRLTYKERMLAHYDMTVNSQLNQWLNDNIECWVYVYISSGQYNRINSDGETVKNWYIDNINYAKTTTDYTSIVSSQKGGTSVLCYPIYKGQNQIKFKNNATGKVETTSWDSFGWSGFRTENNVTPYAIKYSLLAPFKFDNYTNYTINGDLIISTDIYNGSSYINYKNLQIEKTTLAGNLIALVTYQDISQPVKMTVNKLTYDKDIAVSEIITNSNLTKYNPKMYNSDIKSLLIKINGNQYEYDIAKINSNNPTFNYYEVLTPDITKSLLVLNPPDNSIYVKATANNYSGLMATQDMSILFSNTKLDEYLANNKNAFLSFQTNQVFAGVKGIAGAVAAGATTRALGGPTNPVLAGVNVASSGVNTATNLIQNSIQFGLTIDNMRSAPNTLVNANGNAILLNAIQELGCYLEIYEAIPYEQDMVNDYIRYYGYTVNIIDDLHKYFNSRKVYNYIKTNVNNIDGPISNNVKDIFKEMFNRGVRIWHIDDIDFNKSNYEVILDGE